MLRYKLKCQKGFTLIEMAVVLVIIGIILTTVIKGGEVLRSSRIKGVIQTQNDLQQAAMFYREKFGNKTLTIGNLQAEGFLTGAVDGTNTLVDSSFGVKITFSNYSFSSPAGGKVSIQAVKYSDMPFDVAQAMETAIDGVAGTASSGSVQGSTKEPGPVLGTYLDNNYMSGPSTTLYTIFCALYPVAP